MVNIGSLSTGGRVLAIKDELAKIQLTNPVCTEVSEKIALSRRVDKNFRLIGWGEIRRGTVIKPQVEVLATRTITGNQNTIQYYCSSFDQLQAMECITLCFFLNKKKRAFAR